MCRKWNPPTLLAGMLCISGTASNNSSMEFPQKAKNRASK